MSMQTSLFSPAELNDLHSMEIDRTFNVLDEKYLDTVCRAIKRSGTVCLDVETTGLDINAELVGVGLAWKDKEYGKNGSITEVISSVYIPVGHITNTRQITIDVVREYLQDIFDTVLVLAYNIGFELKVMQRYKLRISNFHDVKYDCIAVDEAHYRMSLKEVAERFLGVKWGTIKEIATKKVKERNANNRLVTKSVFDVPSTNITVLGDYCRMDCVYTYMLWEKFAPLVEYAKNIINLERRVTPVVVAMETRGVQIDMDALRTKLVRTNEELEKLIEGIYGAASQVVNLNSPKQMKELLYGKLGLPPQYDERKLRRRKDLGIEVSDCLTTDVNALQALKDLHMVPHLMLQYRELEKIRGTYLEPLLEKQVNGRIYTSLNQLGTESGRFSSNGPNLQNIPADPEIRALFIPTVGMVMIDVDYSQIEGRVFAHVSQDPVLLEYYRNGGDIHTATSEKLKIDRKLAKVINFAIIYGCTAKKLVEIMESKGFVYTIKEGKNMIDNFWGVYEVAYNWRAEFLQEVHETKCAYTVYGRRRLFPHIDSYGNEIETPWGTRREFQSQVEAMEREATNFAIQGTAADIMKYGMVDSYAGLERANFPAKALLTVHDELMFEAFPENVEKAKIIICNRMRDCVTLSVPLEVEAKVGKNWAECH